MIQRGTLGSREGKDSPWVSQSISSRAGTAQLCHLPQGPCCAWSYSPCFSTPRNTPVKQNSYPWLPDSLPGETRKEQQNHTICFRMRVGRKAVSEVYIPFIIFSPAGHPAVFEHPRWQGNWNLQNTLLPSLSSFAVNRIPSPCILCVGRPKGHTSARPLWEAVNWAAIVFASLSLTRSSVSKGRAGSEFIFPCPEI